MLLSFVAEHLQKMSRTKCPGSETAAVKMGVASLACEKTLENYFREKISPWTRVGRGGFCLRRQICIDCGQPLVHRRYTALKALGTQALRSYSTLKPLVQAVHCIEVFGTQEVWSFSSSVLKSLVQAVHCIEAFGTQEVRSFSCSTLKSLLHM